MPRQAAAVLKIRVPLDARSLQAKTMVIRGLADLSDSVDFVVEIVSRADFAAFEAELRKRGFKHATTPGAPICRWTLGAIVVDAMPY